MAANEWLGVRDRGKGEGHKKQPGPVEVVVVDAVERPSQV